MMVVQPGEKNIFDQRHIENVLFDLFNIRVIRKTLKQVAEQCTLRGKEDRLFMYDNLK